MTMPTNPRFADYLAVLSTGDYLHVVRRRWLLVAICALLGLAGAAVYCRFYPDQYVSRTIIRFIPQQVSEKYVQSNESMIAEQRANALTQTLASTLTARKLIQGIGLYPELRRFLTAADLVERFQRDLKVTSTASQGSSGRSIPTVEISFRSSDPEKAKRVTQQLVEIIYEANRRYKGDESLGTTDFLTSQVQTTRNQLAELEEKLGEDGVQDRIEGGHQWAVKLENLHSLESRLGQVQSNLRSLNQDREERLQEIREIESQLRRVPDTTTAETEPPSMELLRIREWMHDAAVNTMQLRERYKSNHPSLTLAEVAEAKLKEEARQQQARDVELARNRQSRTLKEKQDQLRASLAALDITIRARQDEESRLSRQVREVRATTTRTPQEDTEYLRLTREYMGVKEFYMNLQRKLEESRVATEMERMGRGGVIEVVDPPTTPPSAEQPVFAMKLSLGLAAGLSVGLLIVFGLFSMEPQVRAEAHLQLWQGAVLLAEIPGTTGTRPRWIGRLSSGSAAMIFLLLFTQGCGRIGPHSREHYLKRGDQALVRGEYRVAILEYRRALKEDQRYGEAHEKLSALLMSLGEAEEAYPSLLRAAELLPERRDVQLRLADYIHRVYFGDPARPMTALREIEDIAAKLVSRWPSEPEGYRYQAFVLIERHRPEEAMTTLNTAMARIGSRPALVCDLAAIYVSQQQFETSHQLLAGLVREQTTYEPTYDLLYLQLMERHKTDEAGAVLKAKWQVTGKLDSGLQYAAHLHSTAGLQPAQELMAELASNAAAEPGSNARMGDFWLNRGETALARAAYETGLQTEEPSHSLYVGRLVELGISEKKRKEASTFLQAELRKAPKDLTLSAYRAALDVDSGTPETQIRARMELESILARMPHSAFVRYHLGRAYLRIGETMKAADHLERCVRLDPNYAQGWLALAESDYARGNVQRAQSRVDGLLARAPNHPGGLLLKARLQKEEGRLEEAEHSLHAARQAGAGRDELVLERASIELERGNYNDCRQLLKSAWEGSHEDEGYVFLLAQAEFSGGRVQSALALLSERVARAPESRRLRELYANLLTRTGDLPGAIKAFSQLRRAYPAVGEYSLAVADLYALSGKLRESTSEYQTAQRALPRDSSVWLHYAAVLTATGDLEGAHEAYVKALSLDSSNPFIMNNLAYLLARRGKNLEYALQLAQDATRALPQRREPLDTLAYIHLRVGMRKAAIEDFDRLLLSASPEDKGQLEAARGDVRRGELLIAARRLESMRDNHAKRWGGTRL
ncbi:MAG: tetratricopeptide repeat protein [Acidobacteria bacterium]|nr:tetratricopeptide repeat protein [Acidobacteriota bacterium]